METKKTIMRQSALFTMETCGEAYRRRYCEENTQHYSYLALCGSASHKGREVNFSQKKETYKDLNRSDVTDAARDYVVEKFGENEVQADVEHEELGKPALRTEAIDRSVRMTALDYEFFQRDIQPLAVELDITVELPDAFGFDLAGILDLVDVDMALRDYKTKKATPSQAIADKSEQLTLYDLLFRAQYGQAPSRITLDCIVDLKRGPKAVQLETTRTAVDHQALLNRMAAAYNAIEKGAFVPCSQDHWKCSRNFCEYYTSCPYVIGN